ncbi:protein inscuteable homolog isoform X2 [Atheta coriaria]
MGEFHRSPSKVWWAEEALSFRAFSESPGSQDSGFSDTETSPNIRQQLEKPKTPEKKIPHALAKSDNTTQKTNLTSEIIEKSTPSKSILLQGLITPGKVYYLPNTPNRNLDKLRDVKTEPNHRLYVKLQDGNNKVSRNLFRSVKLNTNDDNNNQSNDVEDVQVGNQYAPHVEVQVQELNSNACFNESEEFDYSDEEVSCNRTLPMVSRKVDNYPPNLSAPAFIYQQEQDKSTSFDKNQENEENNGKILDFEDSEGEMESYFKIKSPKHTSTPKLMQKSSVHRLGRIHAQNLLQKYQQEAGNKPQKLSLETIEERSALDCWIRQQKHNYEPECMTTLQCKSIAAELNTQVNNQAVKTSSVLRNIIQINADIVEFFDYYKNNKSSQNEAPSRLLPLIHDYLELLQNNTNNHKLNIKQLLESSSDINNTLNLSKLHKLYIELHKSALNKHVELFVEAMSDPKCEMDVRCRLTALTSLTLRNDELIPLFIHHGAIQTITAIIDKCEGSSVRGLGLRALTTLCINANSIRKLESVSGLCTISDVICDQSKPDPERIEAIALLAQITAPWIEDNHHIQGLHQYSRRMVKYLTRYLEDTNCCQNILLVTAALANLVAMDTKAIKYLLHQGTVGLLLDIVKRHGNASIYILEQVATLIATMAAVPEARMALCDICAPVALICFLQTRFADENVMVRLRQRAVIGLSRLCTERDAAEQVVEAGGVDKLVQLCKEKPERYDNNAILVAALATLRKITEMCGASVMTEEDAQELIEPKLLDSFKAYAAQNESLV